MSKDSDPPKENKPRHLLEERQRLSKSVLWDIEEYIYTNLAEDAWTQPDGFVPFFMTSNALIAKQYADIVIGFLRDCHREGEGFNLDQERCFYIVECGAGFGRFGFLFIRYFFETIAKLPYLKLRVKYVLTDIAQGNLEFWKQHTALQEFIENGQVDFALYNPILDSEIKLVVSGAVLSSESVQNPIVFIGNYFFDTVGNDFFHVSNGQLQEGLISLYSTEIAKAELHNIKTSNGLESSYTFRDVAEVDNYYPGDPFSLSILKHYQKTLSDQTFLMPIDAFKILSNFTKLSSNQFMMLTTDRGMATSNDFYTGAEIGLALHTSFSLPVNFDAIKHGMEQKGGFVKLPKENEPNFVLASIFSSGDASQFSDTLLAFEEQATNPDSRELNRFMTWLLEQDIEVPVSMFLLLSRLGNRESFHLFNFHTKLITQMKTLNEDDKRQLFDALHKINDNFYFFWKDIDKLWASILASYFIEGGSPSQALTIIEKFEQDHGSTPMLDLMKQSCQLN